MQMASSFPDGTADDINLFAFNCVASVAKDCFTLVRVTEVTTSTEPECKIVRCIVYIFEPSSNGKVFERDVASALRHLTKCVGTEFRLKFPSYTANVLAFNEKTLIDASGCCACLTVEVILN